MRLKCYTYGDDPEETLEYSLQGAASGKRFMTIINNRSSHVIRVADPLRWSTGTRCSLGHA